MKKPLKDRPIVKWAKQHAPDLVGKILQLIGEKKGKPLLVAIGKLIEESNDLTPEQKAEAKKLNDGK